MSMTVKVDVPKKMKQKLPGWQPRLSNADTRLLDECAAAAHTDRKKLIRRLIRLAHRDLMLCRELAEREIIKPANGHEVSVEVK
jgi:hypothetical protein